VYIWKVRFKRVANPREICGNGLRVNMVTHENHVKGEGLDRLADGLVMELAKREI